MSPTTFHRLRCGINATRIVFRHLSHKGMGMSNRCPRTLRFYSTQLMPLNHQYPGLGEPLRFTDSASTENVWYPIGTYGDASGAISDMLLVREVAMMIVMDRLTDKPDWHIKVFNQDIVAKWKAEALAFPVDSIYDEIGIGSVPEPPRLKTILDEACLDYVIQELRSKAEYFKKTGLVPTLDASASIAKSDTLVDEALRDELKSAFAKLKKDQENDPDWHPRSNNRVRNLVHPSLFPLVYGRTPVIKEELVGASPDTPELWAGKGDVIPRPPDAPEPLLYGAAIDPAMWSSDYQWLPANVSLLEDGSVKFTSYVNNLHPGKYQDIYRTLEKLISKSLPAWDLCLAQWERHEPESAGRTRPRFPIPRNPDDLNPENWNPSCPEGFDPSSLVGKNHYQCEEYDYEDPRVVHWSEIREPVQPSPPPFEPWPYGVKPGRSLREQFAGTGLQIIVKMASIELTPGTNPVSPPGGLHIEGMMNEHIVATALYYVDVENLEPSPRLNFEIRTTYDQHERQQRVGQDRYHWLERVHGVALSTDNGACVQPYGSVEARRGRLLAFPNVFLHSADGYGLRDKTKPGSRQLVALWLVDPLRRIISTANIPPQQESWWPDGRISQDGEGVKAMSLEEAKMHREKLMDERSAFREGDEPHRGNRLDGNTYSFCEH
ncbi:hypothetical protein B0I35DRAFT_277891 [Stachybotrys elegans]|uniref:Uncharacterized protein n=1 Tax=Stachybotrys elegans TaxID=80388 RepID=A0A8K0SP04_9HYPO|nr:hypothetical protein B0I35DRAFT_277891 [Stachybotrys elegans]